MHYADVLFASIAIGIAASLAGMIWPFQRGAIGVAINMLAGPVGAVAAMIFTYAILPWDRHHDTPVRLAFAATGALVALAAVHFGWKRYAARRRHAVTRA